MTPDGGRRWGRSSLDAGLGGSVRVQLYWKNRNDLRHYNSLFRLCLSPAMQKMGQQYCLIEVKDFSAVLSFGFFDSQRERTPLGSV